jgi:site-specific DNA recombinase
MTNSSDITLDDLFALTNARPKTGFGYIRVSSLREIRRMQGEITTEVQTDYISSFADREGITIVGWILDLNVSGRREKFLSRKIMPTIKRVAAGEADCVVVYNVSRWGRSSIENQLSEASLWEAGGRLLSATEPNDEKTTTGRFTRQQLYSMAEYQSNLIRDSWVEAHKARLRRGLPRDGRPRLGYRYFREGAAATYTEDPVTGPLLATAYRKFLAGETRWAITQFLRSRGVTLPGDSDKLITYTVLCRALDSGFGAGKIVVNTEKTPKYLPGVHEPVITPDEWELYLAKRHDGEQRGRPPGPKLALQGIMRCGSCHMAMATERQKDGNHKYSCRGRSRIVTSTNKPCPAPTAIRAELVNRALRQWLQNLLSDETECGRAHLQRALAARTAQASAQALSKELDALRATRRNYIRLRATEKIETDAELEELLAEVDAKIDAQQIAIRDVTQQIRAHEIPGDEVFRAVLYGWTEGQLDENAINKALAKLIRAVYVGKGKTASSPNKLDIIPMWEDRGPQVFLGQVRGVDHQAGKHCSRCLAWKAADDFYRRKSGRDAKALTSWCKGCTREYMRAKRSTER